jgi:hypothetical protein
MRNHLIGLVLALVASLAFSPLLPSQTTDRPGTAKAEAAAPTPDLSGLWIRLRDPSHASINLDFGKAISPMTPWAEAKFKAANSVYRSSSPSTVLSDPIFNCFPPGVPRIYLLNFPVQIVQTPGQVIMLFEFDHFVRRIYTDGRAHDKDAGALWMGDSIGRWEETHSLPMRSVSMTRPRSIGKVIRTATLCTLWSIFGALTMTPWWSTSRLTIRRRIRNLGRPS